VDLLQHFNYSADLPLLWYCFLSVKSHNKGQQRVLGVLLHLHCPPAVDFGFHIAFALPKTKFLILWATANGVQRNSLAKSGILSGISLAYLSTALKNRPDEKHCLSLTPMVSSRLLSM